ncbi:MAG: putative (di)nucleoside polyphosphate hydrolase [Gammaproteobacteria bacterium]|nr:MAG: putative (di)nucleoside polyphosphate hydrolase [Gammaproteobacteria bacterium]TND03446.1 MAG: putative (di)nucleoside polyphosphate hydrolase [Gammaproteobacteria bacterium]
MIDNCGYRSNVGIILSNQDNRVFWARRVGQNAWQFPQGGVRENETIEQAMYRELEEEIGLRDEHVMVMGRTSGWLRYRLPRRLVRYDMEPVCIGQKQVWFMLRLIGDESNVRFDRSDKPEFDRWRWVSYWRPMEDVVEFKRKVYADALRQLAPLVFDSMTPVESS